MAKQSFPGIQTKSGGILPKMIGILVLVGLLALVINQPAEAAQLAKNIGGMLSGAVDSLATFLNQAAS